MQPFAGRFCSVPGAKWLPAGRSISCSARDTSRRRTTPPLWQVAIGRGTREASDAGVRAPPPGRSRRGVEANLANRGSRPVDVWVQLPLAAEGVDGELPAAAREHELAQVDVPVPLTRPADVLAGREDLAPQDERVDVPVPEVADACEAPDTAGRRQENWASLHGVYAVRASRRRATLR